MAALKKIGKTILDLFTEEAADRNLSVSTLLREGYIVEEVLCQEKNYDLLIVGHRGRSQRKMPSTTILGSVAERVALNADMPVLITVQPVSEIDQITVAYDGSESARGALLMAESLAKDIGCKFKAITVVSDKDDKAKSKLLIEEGESYLRQYWPESVFSIKEGMIAEKLLEDGSLGHHLLVVGAYGYRELDRNVLGSTTTSIIRQAKTSVLIYKPNLIKSRSENAKRSQKLHIQ